MPDRFYLPALKIEADLGSTRLVSNTSYYVRDELTGYEGTDYNLSYYQTIGWPTVSGGRLCSIRRYYPLIDSIGVHLPPGLTNYHAPATVKNQQRSFTQEDAPAVQRPGQPLDLDRRRLSSRPAASSASSRSTTRWPMRC